MAKTQEQMDKERLAEAVGKARSAATADTGAQVATGAGRGALQGAMTGASLGSAIPVVGTVGGALVGAMIGAYAGGSSAEKAEKQQLSDFEKQARSAEKQRQEQAKETAKLQRQMITTSQQTGRARSAEGASTIKQPTMSTPAGEDIAMAAMPVATRRGTQYDAWRQQTYGG
jgi:phage tail tape-measure protein